MQDKLWAVCLLFQNPACHRGHGAGMCVGSPALLVASAAGAAIAVSSGGGCYQQRQPGTAYLTIML